MSTAVLASTVLVCLASPLLAQTRGGNTAPAAPKTATAPSALDKPTLEAFLRHQFMIPANIRFTIEDPKQSELPSMYLVGVNLTDGGQMKQRVEFFVSADGRKMIQGKVFDVRESPFAEDLKLLRTEGYPSTGPTDAPVTLAVFSDFQCQYCKEAARTIRTNVEKEYASRVRVVFMDFPLEQIHPWAKSAALAGRCVHKLDSGAFWQFHDWIFEQQANVTPENLKQKTLEFLNGRVDTLQLTQCLDGKVPEKDIEASMAAGRSLQVTSTPTLFINGRRLIGNVAWTDLKRVLDYELDYAAKHSSSAKREEPCCEVKLPIPGAAK